MAESEIITLHAKAPDGKLVGQVTTRVQDRDVTVWRTTIGTGPLIFGQTFDSPTPSAGSLYLKIDYIDVGYGALNVELVPNGKAPIRPDRYLGLSRTNSGKVVSARMRLVNAVPMACGNFSVRVGRARHDDAALDVVQASLHKTPFPDEDFLYVISDPWKGPYRGPSVKPLGNNTLRGKVMVGYQGWYRTPNDPAGKGWVHWGNIPQGTFSVDQWPDVSQYPASALEKAGDIKLKSGHQAYLFSSAWPAVVDTHFRWMRENDIDGAFLQRFLSDNFHSISGKPEWVLSNVRAAANREGRIWAVEYDVSGYPDSKLLETLQRDWKWFVDEFKLLEDPNYAREGDKPVVFIWGMPFPNRKISPETANAVVNFFKNDPTYGGNHVIGGIPGNWRTMGPEWQSHFTRYDCVLSWMSQNYAEDIADFKKLGLSYYPHVKPGFSWANLKRLPTGDDTIQYTPREGGEYYWRQLAKAAGAGADRFFVGMFDEYDEATAIMPMSDDVPPTPVGKGVAATFYPGAQAQEHGDLVLLRSTELPLGNSPPSKTTNKDHFYVRMSGRIVFPVAGDYTFSVESAPGDDVELFLNGENVIRSNNLKEIAKATKIFAVKAGGSMTYRLQCRHRTGAGTLRLMWERPGLLRQAVPPECLEDAWGRFIGNEGKSADWWLKLTRMGKEMITGERPISPHILSSAEEDVTSAQPSR